MDLLEALCFDAELMGWDGIGFVVQAYQKRCPFVIDQCREREPPLVEISPGQFAACWRAPLDSALA